jgi:hypothetical protein
VAENHETHDNKRIKRLAERLADEYVTETGDAVPADHVGAIVDAVAEPLAKAPVQEFVPLLIENAARDRLHAEGLHVEPAEEDTAPARRGDDEGANRLVSGYARADVERRR